jgi:transposase
MKPYSNDFRQKVVDAYEHKEGSMRALARRFSVSLDFVFRLMKRYRQTLGVDPKPHGGGQVRKLTAYDARVLKDLVEAHPEATLSELNEWLKEKTDVAVSDSTISLSLRRAGITRKKLSYHASEREADETIEQAREQFQQAQATMDTQQLIFIDEAGVNLGMARRYGRAPRGCRARASKPVNKGPNMTLVGALGLSGVNAIMELEGAINGNAFESFVRQCLVPTLQPDDQVWLDNLSSHKVEGIQEAIEAKQAELHFLPSYSPDFSPIESFWSKIKESLRGSAPRTREALDGEIRNALDEVTESDIKGWFKHCGYCTEPG